MMKAHSGTPCRHGIRRQDCLTCLRQHVGFLEDKIKKQQAEIDRLQGLVNTLAERVEAQSELQSKQAEPEVKSRERIEVKRGRAPRAKPGR